MAGRTQEDVLRFFAEPGEVTSIAGHAKLADWLTSDIRALNQVVQGLLIHDAWLQRYGVSFNDEQRYDQHSLTMDALLDKAEALDDRVMAIPRA